MRDAHSDKRRGTSQPPRANSPSPTSPTAPRLTLASARSILAPPARQRADEETRRRRHRDSREGMRLNLRFGLGHGLARRLFRLHDLLFVTIKSRVNRGRARLTELLGADFGSFADHANAHAPSLSGGIAKSGGVAA